MAWHWKKSDACDLDELLDHLNTQMKDLEGALTASRPAIMAGYPHAVGAITQNTESSHTGDTTETTLKEFDFKRGSISRKGGFRITAAGSTSGTGATKDISLKWGGATLFTLNVANVEGREWSIIAELWNADTTQDQRVYIRAYDGTTLETMDIDLVQVDTL